MQVMDYQTQQLKLLPLIATSYALILTGRYMLTLHLQSRSEIAAGNLECLPEVCTVYCPCSSLPLLTFSLSILHFPVASYCIPNS